VKVEYAATDNLSGVSSFEIAFESPSGNVRQSGSAAIPPALAIKGSVDVKFPQSSESGQWTLSSVFLSDAAGNTVTLDKDALEELGFRAVLAVKSVADTVSPFLTALRIAPSAINTQAGPAIVKVGFTVTDDLSGVTSTEIVFVSPSGLTRQRAVATFSPASAVSNSVDVTFPESSESGVWTLASVYLSDAAGNTRLLDTEEVARLGFRTVLTVTGSK
jgi:hypothetical protein